MNIHEYQAKKLFRDIGLSVPAGEVARSAEEAAQIYQKMGNKRVVVKAQVHAGGRGKAGGVKIVDTKEDLDVAVKSMVGKRLVTYQTDEKGQPVNQVLLEEPCEIAEELYLGAVVDRAKTKVVFMLSTEGGVEIEKVAEETPEKIFYIAVDPAVGMMPYQVREVGFKLGLNKLQVRQLLDILSKLSKAFQDFDLSLLEVNPLVITKAGDLICLDGKINADDNAMYRQSLLKSFRDPSQEDAREERAQQWELNYIALDGNIGCMVNGAGLAMATMDLIKLHGGLPANFLDVGGSATKERVIEAFKIILSDESVDAILVNIFGGIVRCDLIAEGIIGAVKEMQMTVPVVVRLAGNNADLGRKKLADSGLNIIASEGFDDAAKKVVAVVKNKEKK
jgi:succinyl-CoA synthetase beta subunit